MGDPRLSAVFAVFEAVFDVLAERRRDRLKTLCADDSELLRQVEAMLFADGIPGDLDTRVEGLPAAVADVVHQLILPETIGHFEVIDELGRGAMGVVYEAQQRDPDRRVAIKTVLPHADITAVKALFATEIQALGQVLHPGIPQLYETFEHEGLPALVMELVRGEALSEAVRDLRQPQRLALLARIADAVHHAHVCGVVHRDLKPANVLVTTEGQPKVLDFGIASLGGSGADRRDPGRPGPVGRARPSATTRRLCNSLERRMVDTRPLSPHLANLCYEPFQRAGLGP